VFKNNLEIITLNKPGITDFASERNVLLDKSKSEWVFFVDSDEEISKELKQEIAKWLNGRMIDKYGGFYVYRKNYFLGQCIGTDNILRLGRKNAGSWNRKVHEVWKINGKVGQLENPLVHNTADNLYKYISKINKYSDIHATENFNEGKKSNLFKIVFFPVGKFILTLIKSKNVVFSIMQSFHSFLSWSKEWKLQNA
jgi:glycosyltransferase involved in cell wall biosynthesis